MTNYVTVSIVYSLLMCQDLFYHDPQDQRMMFNPVFFSHLDYEETRTSLLSHEHQERMTRRLNSEEKQV